MIEGSRVTNTSEGRHNAPDPPERTIRRSRREGARLLRRGMSLGFAMDGAPDTTGADARRPSAAAAQPRGNRLVFHIGGLCLGIAIPLLGIIGGAQWSYAARERQEVEAGAIARARDVAAAVDRELVGLTSALDVLGTAASLQRGDVPTFGEMVAGVSKRTGVVPILRDVDGRQIINPFLPAGTTPPEPRIQEIDREALRTGEVQVSDLFDELSTGAPVFALELAVRRKELPAYLLGIAVPTERIRAGIAPQAMGDWSVSVVDGRGRLIYGTDIRARTGDAVDPLPHSAAQLRQGLFVRDVDGAPRVVAFAKSQRSGWTVAVETSQDAYEAPMRRSLRFFALAAGAAILLSLVFAVLASRRLARSLGSLADRAQAVGRGEAVAAEVSTNVAEVDEVARALDVAAEEVRRRIEAEEKATEAGRQVLSTFETIGDAVAVVGRDGAFGYLNDLARSTLAGGADVVGRPVQDVLPPSELPGLDALLAKAREEGTLQRGEIVHASADRWYEIAVVPSAGGSTVFFRDVTERRRGIEAREMMVRELHHRVKNTLATVQAIAAASSRTATDLDEFRDAFADRIVSLSRTHTLLREQSWEHVDLRQLVAGETAAYDEAGRVRIQGAELQLPSGLGMTLGMALHELTTNAVKYGALSAASGCIAVSWNVTADADGETRLQLRWSESGGPPVTEPTWSGFGSQLLGKMLTRQFGARVERDWAPTGLEVVIDTRLGA